MKHRPKKRPRTPAERDAKLYKDALRNSVKDFDQICWEHKTLTQNCRMFGEQANMLHTALIDLLRYWDRRDESGWTAADVKRLEEIRKLVTHDS